MDNKEGASTPNNVTPSASKAGENRYTAIKAAAISDEPANVAKPGLPIGANIIVQQQKRNLFYNLRTGETSSGDATIHGLYPVGNNGPTEKSTLVSKFPNPFSESEPSDEDRKTFMRNSYAMESLLSEFPNLTSFDERRKEFLKRVDKFNSLMEKNAGGSVTKDWLQKYAAWINSCACKYIELKVIFVRVGVPAHTKGSKLRADGLWTKTTTVRNVSLSRFLSEDEVKTLVHALMITTDIPSATVTNYRVERSKDGKGFRLNAVGYTSGPN